MSYISATLSKDRRFVDVWERNNGKRIKKRYDAPYNFYIKNSNGLYKDIYGNNLERIDCIDSKELWQAKLHYKDIGENLYESDISPIYKVLSKNYYKKEVENFNITYFDIEVDYDDRGFATVENPYAPVNAISLYHQHIDKMILLVILPENGKWSKTDIPKDLYDLAEIIVCKNEKELLLRFLDEIENSDIISGWNSSGYDIPYLYFRMLSRYNEGMANRLSFPDAPSPKIKEIEVFVGQIQKQINIFGRVHIDYLELFKKFETTTRPSFSLEAISDEIMPELKKLEYDGTLRQLYNDNFPHFCRYNIRDTEVLKGFEAKLGYIGIAIAATHSSTVPMEDILGTIKFCETAINNYCHYERKLKVNDVKDNGYYGKFSGALVLFPKVGMHENVASVDFNSLYPSTIRMLNASPETIIGQFLDTHKAYEEITKRSNIPLSLVFENGDIETKPAKEWPKILKGFKWSLSAHGTVFDQSVPGIIPTILTEWYNDRIVAKAKAKQAKKQSKKFDKTSLEYIKCITEYDYWHKVQFTLKIRLNSVYGMLGNIFCRFFDLRLAESTTKTGKECLLHMNRTIANEIEGKEKFKWESAQELNEDYSFPHPNIIYSDTDSSYFKINMPIGNIDLVYDYAKKMEKTVNDAMPSFIENYLFCTDEYKNILKAELDVIADRSIFIKKKYYIMHLLYNEGVKDEKMKVMGLQIKKTTIPKHIGSALTKYIERLLTGTDWNILANEIVKYKSELLNYDITQIGLPKGIKGIEDYTSRANRDEPNLRIPGHVSAAMFYNKCLEIYDDKESPKIVSGMKIKTYYLNKNFEKFKSIALPTDLKKPPEWFNKYFKGLIDREAQLNRLVDKPLQSILTAIGEYAPTHKTILSLDCFDY